MTDVRVAVDDRPVAGAAAPATRHFDGEVELSCNVVVEVVEFRVLRAVQNVAAIGVPNNAEQRHVPLLTLESAHISSRSIAGFRKGVISGKNEFPFLPRIIYDRKNCDFRFPKNGFKLYKMFLYTQCCSTFEKINFY